MASFVAKRDKQNYFSAKMSIFPQPATRMKYTLTFFVAIHGDSEEHFLDISILRGKSLYINDPFGRHSGRNVENWVFFLTFWKFFVSFWGVDLIDIYVKTDRDGIFRTKFKATFVAIYVNLRHRDSNLRQNAVSLSMCCRLFVEML